MISQDSGPVKNKYKCYLLTGIASFLPQISLPTHPFILNTLLKQNLIWSRPEGPLVNKQSETSCVVNKFNKQIYLYLYTNEHLSDCVSISVTDCNTLVFSTQSQKVLGKVKTIFNMFRLSSIKHNSCWDQ